MSELVTLEQLAGFLQRDLDEADAWTGQLLLDGAEALVREYCGWHIAPSRTETVTVDGTGSTLVGLPTMWLTDLTAVTEDGNPVDLSTVMWSVDGILEKRAWASWTGSAWWPWTTTRRGITATITHGHASCPLWLVTLVCALAGRSLQATVGVRSESSGGESVTWDVPAFGLGGSLVLLDADRRMLDRLRIFNRP